MPGQAHMYTTGLREFSLVGPKAPLGTIRVENSDAYKYVKYVKGAAAITVITGDVVRYIAAAGYDANEVTGDEVADNIGAGVVIARNADGTSRTFTTAEMDATNGVHGWIQIKGDALLSATLALTIGNGVITLGAADRTVAVATATAAQVGVTLANGAGTSRILCDFPY